VVTGAGAGVGVERLVAKQMAAVLEWAATVVGVGAGAGAAKEAVVWQQGSAPRNGRARRDRLEPQEAGPARTMADATRDTKGGVNESRRVPLRSQTAHPHHREEDRRREASDAGGKALTRTRVGASSMGRTAGRNGGRSRGRHRSAAKFATGGWMASRAIQQRNDDKRYPLVRKCQVRASLSDSTLSIFRLAIPG